MTHTLICHLPQGGGWEGAFMKTYIQPSITVVHLQQQNIICTSPGGYEDYDFYIPSGTDNNQINNESFVWTRESSVWEDEW